MSPLAWAGVAALRYRADALLGEGKICTGGGRLESRNHETSSMLSMCKVFVAGSTLPTTFTRLS
jgi:hypothetical protein